MEPLVVTKGFTGYPAFFSRICLVFPPNYYPARVYKVSYPTPLGPRAGKKIKLVGK